MIDTLTGNMIVFPVYFAFENDELLNWYSMLARKDAKVKDVVVQVRPTSQRTHLTEQMSLDVFYGYE